MHRRTRIITAGNILHRKISHCFTSRYGVMVNGHLTANTINRGTNSSELIPILSAILVALVSILYLLLLILVTLLYVV